MASSHAHTKLDCDLQIHNLLIRLYFWHCVSMMVLSLKPHDSRVETESKTNCWGRLFFFPPPPLFLLVLSPQIERTSLFFAREYTGLFHCGMTLNQYALLKLLLFQQTKVIVDKMTFVLRSHISVNGSLITLMHASFPLSILGNSITWFSIVHSTFYK